MQMKFYQLGKRDDPYVYTRRNRIYTKGTGTRGKFGTVLRAKGMVAGEDGNWIYFDMVPEEQEVRSGAPEYTGRICVIGSKIARRKAGEAVRTCRIAA